MTGQCPVLPERVISKPALWLGLKKYKQRLRGLPLQDRAYLHVSSEGKEDRVVITGVPDAGMDGENVLLLL